MVTLVSTSCIFVMFFHDYYMWYFTRTHNNVFAVSFFIFVLRNKQYVVYNFFGGVFRSFFYPFIPVSTILFFFKSFSNNISLCCFLCYYWSLDFLVYFSWGGPSWSFLPSQNICTLLYLSRPSASSILTCAYISRKLCRYSCILFLNFFFPFWLFGSNHTFIWL